MTNWAIPPSFDYGATFAWALSGTVVGIQKRLDIVGVFVMALLSSTGGGLMRDGLFLQRTPPLLTDPVYLPIIALAASLTSLFTGRPTRIPWAAKLIDIIDGIPAFAVIGMQLAQDAHVSTPGVIFIGIVNRAGGGLLRDVIVGEVPALLRPDSSPLYYYC